MCSLKFHLISKVDFRSQVSLFWPQQKFEHMAEVNIQMKTVDQNGQLSLLPYHMTPIPHEKEKLDVWGVSFVRIGMECNDGCVCT